MNTMCILMQCCMHVLCSVIFWLYTMTYFHVMQEFNVIDWKYWEATQDHGSVWFHYLYIVVSTHFSKVIL